jgi:hypothetical protein
LVVTNYSESAEFLGFHNISKDFCLGVCGFGAYWNGTTLSTHQFDRLNLFYNCIGSWIAPDFSFTPRKIATEFVDDSKGRSNVHYINLYGLSAIGIMDRFVNKSYDHAETMSRNEIILGQSEDFESQASLPASRDPQSAGEGSNNNGSERGNTSIMSIDKPDGTARIRDDGTDTAVAFFGDLFTFVAAFLPYAGLKRWWRRHISQTSKRRLRKQTESQEVLRFLSASCNGHSEDVSVLAIIVVELEFGDIDRKIFAADCADNRDFAGADAAAGARISSTANAILSRAMKLESVKIARRRLPVTLRIVDADGNLVRSR